MKLIGRVTEGKTLIIVEHDMEVVFSLADRITVIYYGEVLASGPPEEIRKDQKVKDAYLGEEKRRIRPCCWSQRAEHLLRTKSYPPGNLLRRGSRGNRLPPRDETAWARVPP